MPWVASVSVRPGRTQLTRTLNSPSSSAATLQNISRPALAAQYAPKKGALWLPCIDEIATIDPPPWRTIALPAWRSRRKNDVMFWRMVDSSWSTVNCRIGAAPVAPPTMPQAMSTRPVGSAVISTSALT